MQNKHLLKMVLCSLSILLLLFAQTSQARPFFGRTLQLPIQKMAPGAGKIVIDFLTPINYELSQEAPSNIFIRTKNPQLLKTSHTKPEPLDLSKLPYSTTYSAQAGETIVAIDARVHFCDKVIRVCLVDFVRIKFPVEIKSGNSSELHLRIPLKSKITE